MIYYYKENELKLINESFKDDLVKGQINVKLNKKFSFNIDTGAVLDSPYLEIKGRDIHELYLYPTLKPCSCHGGYVTDPNEVKEIDLEYTTLYLFQSDDVLITKEGIGLTPKSPENDLVGVKAVNPIHIEGLKYELDLFKIENIRTHLKTLGYDEGVFETENYVIWAKIAKILGNRV